MARLWILVYAFVGIRKGWVLSPFIGNPAEPPEFLRTEAWSNAYVMILRLSWSVVGGGGSRRKAGKTFGSHGARKKLRMEIHRSYSFLFAQESTVLATAIATRPAARRLLLAMPNFGSLSTFSAADFSTSLTRLFRSHCERIPAICGGNLKPANLSRCRFSCNARGQLAF